MIRDVPPDTLVDGRYRVLSRIGSGGMADVYCAQDTQLGRNVAVKLLHRRFAEDREFVERFRREASSAAGLSHPNVVGVFDRGEWDGTSYIAMEYLEGRTLKRLIDAEAPLDPIRAIDLAVQVLRAARFAHKRGIIHRDLKPHNVIVDAEDRAKVTDFGIARAGASDMTQTGSIMGTAQYLSPEQAQGEPVTPRSDLYAIGIVLYEMLTGRLPFDGESAVTIALKQVNEAPVPPSAYNGAVTPELEGIVLHALEKDPARRFADADEFIVALDRCRGHLAAGQDPGVAATAFAPPPPPYEPAAPPPRSRGPWIAALVVLLLAAAAAAAYFLTRPDTRPVPNVTGKPVQAALAIVQNAGFDANIQRTPADAPKNRVIRQNPQPGVRADEGSEVTLTVSDGPGTKAVPDVTSKTQKEASDALRKAGFKVAARHETSTDVDRGLVMSTVPDAGQQLEIGSTVTLVVSRGPPQVTVPSVVGSDVDSAQATLDSAGLHADITEQEDDSHDPGTVLAQSPAGGTLPEGSTVKLTVATEPTTTTVPAVTGQDETSAANALGAAHLQFEEKSKDVDTAAQDGIVLKQTPKAGQEVKRGRTVKLTVGRYTPPPETTPTPTTPTTTTTTPGGGTPPATTPTTP